MVPCSGFTTETNSRCCMWYVVPYCKIDTSLVHSIGVAGASWEFWHWPNSLIMKVLCWRFVMGQNSGDYKKELTTKLLLATAVTWLTISWI